jgi:ribosomal protein S18 acetylase RimI-like enzyme
LGLLFRDLPDDVRRRQLEATLEQFRAEPAAGGGLLEARSGGHRFGTIWIQLQAGRVASLWPPQVADETIVESDRAVQMLLAAAIELAQRGGARMIQALLQTDAGTAVQRLRGAGFEHAADLLYLVSPASAFPSAAPPDGLEFEPFSGAAAARFETIVERTYAGTRDCPRLNGVRPTAEVLAGYRSVGDFKPVNWLIARHGEADVGCLILAEHPEQRIWELVYMGVVPESRGRGWGLALARQAQWMSRLAGAERLVLAVDAANEPALRGYAAAGFIGWDRRSVFLSLLP